MYAFRSGRRVFSGSMMVLAALLAGVASGVLGVCGPFADVSDAGFCPFVLEIFTLGITTGMTPTTYAPGDPVSRLQMAAFLARTVDRTLQRGSRRSAARQFWTPQNNTLFGGTTTGGGGLRLVESDGTDLWVATANDTVARVRGSDGRLVETWTGASGAFGVVVALGRVFVSGSTNPGRLYIVTPGATIPWTVTNTYLGFSHPVGALYDGGSIWVTDSNLNQLLKLSPTGAILQTVTVGAAPQHPLFDGTNIWVPSIDSSSVTVVRAATGAVLTTLTGNGINKPVAAAFDGERVLVTNLNGNMVSLFRAADLTSIGSFPIAAGQQIGACSDGLNFWIAVFSNPLVRF